MSIKLYIFPSHLARSTLFNCDAVEICVLVRCPLAGNPIACRLPL